MVSFEQMLQILAGEGGTALGRFICFAPFQREGEDATRVGEASSLAGAFEVLATTVAEVLSDEEVAPDFLHQLQQAAPDCAEALAAIATREGLLLAGAMLNFNLGCYDILTTEEEASSDVYVGYLLNGVVCNWDHVFAASAAPPHQDAAFAILQIKPEGAGALSPAERALAEAAEAGDLVGIERALEAGARVSAADERGMSALHRAVARGKGAAVRALLAAGANPRLGSDDGNAPMFAAFDRGLVGPYLSKIGGEEHFSILGDLVAAGASLDDKNEREETLADLARATSPRMAKLVAELEVEAAKREAEATTKAIAALKAVTLADPGDAAASRRLGLLLAKQGHHDEAATALAVAHRASPADVELAVALAASYEALSRLDDAAPLLAIAARERPEDAKLQGRLSAAHQAGGRFEEAAAAYQRVVDLGHEDAPKLLHLGKLYEQARQPEQALRAFLRAYRADRHNMATIPLICGTLQALGRGPVELTIPDANADALTLSFDPIKREIHASVTIARHIKWNADPPGPKADGIETHRFEHTLDPNDPDSWEGDADIGESRRHIHIIGLSPGLYWFRMKSTRGGHDSAYIGPVSVLVTWAPRKAGSRKPATRKPARQQ